MVHYSREKGIDDGAIHMAFLTDAMPDIKTIVFPTEASCGSILDVHNSNLFVCGQIKTIPIEHSDFIVKNGYAGVIDVDAGLN